MSKHKQEMCVHASVWARVCNSEHSLHTSCTNVNLPFLLLIPLYFELICVCLWTELNGENCFSEMYHILRLRQDCNMDKVRTFTPVISHPRLLSVVVVIQFSVHPLIILIIVTRWRAVVNDERNFVILCVCVSSCQHEDIDHLRFCGHRNKVSKVI